MTETLDFYQRIDDRAVHSCLQRLLERSRSSRVWAVGARTVLPADLHQAKIGVKGSQGGGHPALAVLVANVPARV